MKLPSPVLLIFGFTFGFTAAGVLSGRLAQAQSVESFRTDVKPFLMSNCLDCHAAPDPEAALDLSQFDSADSVVQHFATWDLIRNRVAAGEMPPSDSGLDPSDAERQRFLDWIRRWRDDYARRHAGDPGEVLARRLSAAEYNYTIRDLTGMDIRPAAEFPIDPSNEAGFDNSGESLMMTPSLLNKYLDAARKVADHLLFTPDGLQFAPHPVVTETDRDKYCVRRIIDFYQQQNTDIADYFLGAWRVKQRNEVTTVATAEIARQHGLSEKYLRTVWQLLIGNNDHYGPIRELRERFEALPLDEQAAAGACEEMASYVKAIREKLAFDFPHLQVSGINRGSQPLVLWHNRQQASHRMRLNREALNELVDGEQNTEPDDIEPDDIELDDIEPDDIELDDIELDDIELDDIKTNEEDSQNDATDSSAADSQLPDIVAAYERFCRIFPDAFYVDRRGREYLGSKRKRDFNRESEVRLLSAGFHSMMGYFRDDQPLCELMLTAEENRRLNRLWFELDFIANAPLRQHSGFIWFERAEGRFLVDAQFDAFRSADKNVTSEDMIQRLREVYIAKARRLGASDEAIDAMQFHFETINASIRAVEEARLAARKTQLAMLPELAERAYRRPLTNQERLDTVAFYHQLVAEEGLAHHDAVRDVLVSILMSPHFCYRLHASDSPEAIHPLSSYDLANRLSYFLWSSMPDGELLSLARGGTIHDDTVLREQVKRMLRSPKARALAIEFAGNWLGFRQFQSHNSVDRRRFTQFDDTLREAMFEEPVRFTLDVIQHNRSVLDFLYADHTFVNATLARHYGISNTLDFDQTGWARVSEARRIGRGGILPMAVFLTKNSPGLRTSPVKRGYWVVRQLLGTHIPAPPPNVPELPEDESKLGELTLREVLAKHRDHASCAGCHEKFDSVGLVFEGFGPIGERRENDLAGNPVDVSAPFPDGSQRKGIDGLRDYLQDQREEEFVDTLCRKLLSYGLGRSLILSDEPLITEMTQRLVDDDYAFHCLVEAIVLSPQFLNQRGKGSSPGPYHVQPLP